MKGVCTPVAPQEGLAQPKLCCGAVTRMSSESVEVLIMDIFPSWAFAAYTRVPSTEGAMETVPEPTGITFFSNKPTASITLTCCPCSLQGSSADSCDWFRQDN